MLASSKSNSGSKSGVIGLHKLKLGDGWLDLKVEVVWGEGSVGGFEYRCGLSVTQPSKQGFI